MRTKLSPFVYKIKGKKNYLLFDSLRKLLFNIIPEGDPKELEAELIKNDLVIETNGVVPYQFKPNVGHYQSSLVLRELQIRITGKCEEKCEKCGEIGECFKDDQEMPKKILDLIIDQMSVVQIESIVIIGGNPLLEMELIKTIKEKIAAPKYRVFLKNKENVKEKLHLLKDMGITAADSICDNQTIDEKNMEVDISDFFYNQEYNPCWGNKLAVDVQGDIKPCLWSNEIIGNVKKDNIKDLIFSGKFNNLWVFPKDKFEVCKECEYRYSCSDCRVITQKESGSLNAKTAYCTYNPETGEWG